MLRLRRTRALTYATSTATLSLFDAAKAGELSAATSEKVQILQNGTAKKMGELVQSTFTGVGGLAVGFYFSWELSLVIMAGVPMLAGALYFLVKATTKLTAANPEYEKAGAIATESLTACRVTSALNAQGRVAERYESHLGDAERVATKNLWNISFANGGLFGVMFIMYAAGLWFGAYLISDSTNGPAVPPRRDCWTRRPPGANTRTSPRCCAMRPNRRRRGRCAPSARLDHSIMETETKLANPTAGAGTQRGSVVHGLSAGSSPCMTGGTVIMQPRRAHRRFSFGMAGSSIMVTGARRRRTNYGSSTEAREEDAGCTHTHGLVPRPSQRHHVQRRPLLLHHATGVPRDRPSSGGMTVTAARAGVVNPP